MQLAFTILAGLGALLVLIGYLGFVFTGFRHHFVTGIISALPVLNIVTVPALWAKAKGKVITSIFGIIIFVASWFLGANSGIQKYLGLLKGNNQSTQTVIASPSNTETNTSHTTASSTSQRSFNESNMQQLPKKALYKMKFEVVPVEQIQSLKDRVVRVITTNSENIEGRITSVSASSIIINNNELPLANIKKISLMVKNAN